MNLTKEDVRDIVRLLDASGFDQLRLETDRFNLTLTRAGGERGGWTRESLTKSTSAETPGTVEAAGAPLSEGGEDGTVAIRSPLPGTFYRAPKPGAAPFVEIGSQVGEDTVIGIIETMKLMNSAPAGTRGEVVEIRVSNAEPVEAGQVLMRVRPEQTS